MKSKFIPYYLGIAYETAKLSSANRAKVGAIIVKDDRIISIGLTLYRMCEINTPSGDK